MNLVVKMKFGSHVYGTNLPTSDTDIKQVYLPEPKALILQRVKNTLSVHTKKDLRAKNSADDIDIETFSYQEYLRLLLEGQTVALDMLFTPYNFYETVPHPGWHEIEENKEKFIHKGTSSFVGYCKTQANKYGIKGSRMASLKIAINFLRMLADDEKLINHWYAITTLCSTTEHMVVEDVKGPHEVLLPYWNVCNCKMGQTISVAYARAQFEKIYDNYGERAKLAEKNEGIDWKALMHAVRVAGQAEELLLSGEISFPRPEAPLLLKIRQGQLPYKQVAEIIEQGLEKVEVAKTKSTLRETPDKEFADELVFSAYKNVLDSK